MSERTWSNTKGHHWIDAPTRRGNPVLEKAYSIYTTPMTGLQHVQAHRDTREGGPAFAASRYDLNRIIQGKGFIVI
ncbi:hypothetical protein ACFLWS_03820 [Chloroflexota bacterium]